MRGSCAVILIATAAFAATAATAAFVATAAVGELLPPQACERVLGHVPGPDVAYQPGVDVRGRAVAPADIEPSRIDLPEVLHFDIIVPTPRTRGRRTDRSAFSGEGLVGFVTLLPDGSLLFNGRPMAPADETALRAACREAMRRRR